MIPKFLIKKLIILMLLSYPTVSPAKFFDNLSQKIEKESKRTEKRIKKEVDRSDANFDKITYKSKEKVKCTWDDNRDEIVQVVLAATVLYVGDINLATLVLKEYGIIKEDGTIEWRTIFLDDEKIIQSIHVVHPKKKSLNEDIINHQKHK